MSLFGDTDKVAKDTKKMTKEDLSPQQLSQAKKLFGDTIRMFKDGDKLSIMMSDEVAEAIRRRVIEVVLMEQKVHRF